MRRSLVWVLLIGVGGFALSAAARPLNPDRGPVRGHVTVDDADLSATRDVMALGAGQVIMTLANFGEYANPDGTPGFHGFEYPAYSGNDFLFSSGIWVGAMVNGTAQVTTATDGDNGTGEFWPVHIGTVPLVNEATGNFDWHFGSRHTASYSGVTYQVGASGVDDDGDWTPADDRNGNNIPDANWDGGAGWIGSDDDHDGAVDEEAADGIDNDADGYVDEDTNADSDANHDGNCAYDPEPRVDEDPAGDISHDHLDNDHDGLTDVDDPDYDGDLAVGFADDDGDGMTDEDAAAFGELEALAVYQDSISQQYVSSPSGPHLPLNIEVAQRAMSWPGGAGAAVIGIEYAVRNMGDAPLDNVFLGVFADPDIVARGESGDAGSTDDYNYYDAGRAMAVQGDDSMDADGQGPGLFAMKLLHTPQSLSALRFTFANFERVSGGDPEFDADKYLMMSSGNIFPPASQLGDWRMLFAFGTEATSGFTIFPHQALSFAVAFIGAPNRVALNEIADSFSALYARGTLPQAPLPPVSFHQTGTASGEVSLAWVAPADPTVTAYALYAVGNGGTGERQLVATTSATSYTQTGLPNGSDWLYELHATTATNDPSMPVYVLSRVAAPLPLTGLTAAYLHGAVNLSWNAAPEPGILDYRIERVDRWTTDTTYFSANGVTYADHNVPLGHPLRYRVAAHNSLGIAGFWSDSASVVPWAPSRYLLLLDEYTNTLPAQGGFPRDSVAQLYRDLLAGLGINYQYGTAADYGTLDSIAQFERVLYVNENRTSVNSADREAALSWYVEHGGKLLRIARHLIAGGLVGYPRGAVYHGSPGELAPLTFDSVLVSNWSSAHPGMQFSGATAATPGFPNVALDPARMDSFHFGASYYHYLPEVDLLWPNRETHALYRAQVLAADSSGYASQPCAVYTGHAIAVAFPLYPLERESARQLLGACLIALDTITSDVREPRRIEPVVEQFRLLPNFPNPFNPSTTLRFELAHAAPVKLEIFDLLGRLTATLVEGELPAGMHERVWTPNAAASGIYFARLTAGPTLATRKLVLLK
jgi:hypothetical protein